MTISLNKTGTIGIPKLISLNFKCKIIKIVITEGHNECYSSFSQHETKSKKHEDKLYINKKNISILMRNGRLDLKA